MSGDVLIFFTFIPPFCNNGSNSMLNIERDKSLPPCTLATCVRSSDPGSQSVIQTRNILTKCTISLSITWQIAELTEHAIRVSITIVTLISPQSSYWSAIKCSLKRKSKAIILQMLGCHHDRYAVILFHIWQMFLDSKVVSLKIIKWNIFPCYFSRFFMLDMIFKTKISDGQCQNNKGWKRFDTRKCKSSICEMTNCTQSYRQPYPKAYLIPFVFHSPHSFNFQHGTIFWLQNFHK